MRGGLMDGERVRNAGGTTVCIAFSVSSLTQSSEARTDAAV